MANPNGQGTSDDTPRFAEPLFAIRCPDCEYNGYLTADGRRRSDRSSRVRACETCKNGKLRLITREMLRVKPDLASKIGQPGWLFVSRKETLDPYMFDVKVPEPE